MLENNDKQSDVITLYYFLLRGKPACLRRPANPQRKSSIGQVSTTGERTNPKHAMAAQAPSDINGVHSMAGTASALDTGCQTERLWDALSVGMFR